MDQATDIDRTLTPSDLLDGGFEPVGQWHSDGNGIKPDLQAKPGPAVYAFVLEETVACIGKASSGLGTRKLKGHLT